MLVCHFAIVVYIQKVSRMTLVQCRCMETIIILTAVLQGLAISLGVGSSTLAIVNFFVAIADGKIDEIERKMMGVVYVVLRIAMVAILATTLLLIAMSYQTGISVSQGAQLTILAVLFINAVLMTKHLMPSKYGPSIQAGSWYALSIVSSLAAMEIIEYTYTLFAIVYVIWLVLVTIIVNGVMAWLRPR